MRRRFSGAIAKPCVNVKRSRKATICQTWKIPACGAIIKPCANAKRSCKVAICRAAKTLRQPHSQPVVVYVHGFPCPQVCFLVSRALSRWQSVIPTPPCLRPAIQSAKTLRQPRSQPAVAYVHGFPCPQVCFPVSRALSRWQSVIPTPPCLRPALQSAETPPGPLRAT